MGFMAQSEKTLTFGLGDGGRISKVICVGLAAVAR